MQAAPLFFCAISDCSLGKKLGKLYEARKNANGGARAQERGEHGKFTADHQSGGLRSEDDKRQRTTEYKIAQEQGVGRGTVMRAAQFSKALDDTEELVPGFRDAVISGKASAPKETIRSLNRMTDEERKEAAEAIYLYLYLFLYLFLSVTLCAGSAFVLVLASLILWADAPSEPTLAMAKGKK